MSTRCSIGIKLTNGKVVSIYNHSDGYPTRVGKILDEYYNTRENIMLLMNLGDISMLGTKPISSPALWDMCSGIYELAADMHFNIPLCRTYMGRGDKNNVNARVSANVLEYLLELGEEYNYLYDGGKWFLIWTKDGKTVERQTIYEAIKAEEENGY